jgi:hypothetical protein
MKRRNIHPYLSPELFKSFKSYCSSRNISQSSVVEAALQQYLDDNSDIRLLLRRLDRQGRHLDRIERDQTAMSEAFGVFVQLWFAHTPRLGDEDKKGAEKEAWTRYSQFVDYVYRQLAGGHRFIDDLVQDVVGDEDELKKAVNDDVN